MAPLPLFVRLPSGETVAIEVDSEAAVGAIPEAVAAGGTVLPDGVEFRLGGRTLDPAQLLADSGASAQAVIECAVAGERVPLEGWGTDQVSLGGIIFHIGAQGHERPLEAEWDAISPLKSGVVVHDMSSNGGGGDVEKYGPGWAFGSPTSTKPIQSLWSAGECWIAFYFPRHRVQVTDVVILKDEEHTHPFSVTNVELCTEAPVDDLDADPADMRKAWRVGMASAKWANAGQLRVDQAPSLLRIQVPPRQWASGIRVWSSEGFAIHGGDVYGIFRAL
eukprot:TRINITY_DN70066_c0_g1_i1.p1 TRINITY_DN70066_c0_g1~~TRINITY_DN70066_c0_g1_i1.p1  ORF type:complete len:307 (+),score=50.98 TRINITY_DN70066_c0_g1_i1:92-922(+)